MLALVLPLTISGRGAPLAAAVGGRMAYQVLALLMPMPRLARRLPTLRTMGRHPASQVRDADRVELSPPCSPQQVTTGPATSS